MMILPVSYIKLRPTLLLTVLLAMLALLSHATGAARATAAAENKIDEAVLTATAGNAQTAFLIVLREQASLEEAARISDKTERGRFVYHRLTSVASRSQVPLRTMLDAYGVEYRAYWVNNMIWARGGRELLFALAARPDVMHIYANTWQRADIPTITDSTDTTRAADDLTIEWNIAIVNAPEVWALGYTGQGAVIGGQDTGYEWQHEALIGSYRGWDGTNADHNYNWHDAIHEENPLSSPGNPCGYNAPAPCDDNNHGTHTMGIMAGQTETEGIGMAPGAKWIGCRNMEEGWGSPATYSECFEWFIAPYPIGGDPFTDGDPSKAPHVINNSWACTVSEGCVAPDILRSVVEVVRSAGIITVQSAGNNGSSCGTVNTPAAIYNASFTVGATDVSDNIAFFSSRGPVTIDGSNRRKPDIVAPGQGVRSSIPGNSYVELSGTSMAAPHVAGLVALLISADPSLAGQIDELEEIITQTAIPRTSSQVCGDDQPDSVPNNVYGWGRIDALAAFLKARPPVELFWRFAPVVFSE